jgi:hypothetical protein
MTTLMTEPVDLTADYSVGDAAKLAEESASTIKNRIHAGVLPARRMSNGTRIIYGRDLARYLESRASRI